MLVPCCERYRCVFFVLIVCVITLCMWFIIQIINYLFNGCELFAIPASMSTSSFALKFAGASSWFTTRSWLRSNSSSPIQAYTSRFHVMLERNIKVKPKSELKKKNLFNHLSMKLSNVIKNFSLRNEKKKDSNKSRISYSC